MSDSTTLAVVTVRGTFWSFAAKYSGKTLSFISTIILAWLLTQDDFGLAGYALLIIGFLEVFQDMGVGPALIYLEENPNATDTAFWLSILTGIGLFAITWMIAPLAGTFFSDPRAVPLTRAVGLAFPVSSLSNVHASLLQKNLKFGRHFVPELIRSAGKGIISIVLALLGFGAWSLVLGLVGGRLLGALAYWKAYPWRPSLRFHRQYANKLLSYGFDIILLSAVGALLANVDYLFVGRFLGTVALGVYKLAFIIPDYLINQITSVLGGVIFPVFTKVRDQAQTLNQAFIATVRYVTLISVPLGLGLALVAEPLILTFFSEKWEAAIPVIRAISIYALVDSVAYGSGAIFKAQGRVRLITIMAVVRTLLMIPALWWSLTTFGTIEAVAWTQVGVVFVARVIKMVVVWWIIRYPIGEALKPYITMGLSGILMSLVIYLILMLTPTYSPILQLSVTVAAGGVIYAGGVWLLERELVLDTIKVLKSSLSRQK